MKLTPTLNHLAILVAGFSAGFGAYDAVVRASAGKSLLPFGQAQTFEVAIQKVIIESSLPMYLVDEDLTVRNMNDAAGRLLTLVPQKTNGRSVEYLIRHVAGLVPEQWRECFLAEQNDFNRLMNEGKSPERETIVPIDLTDTIGASMTGKFVLWVRAELLFEKGTNAPIGTLVIVRARSVTNWHDPEIEAQTKKCSRLRD